MPEPTVLFQTPTLAPGWQRWLWYSPLARIVWFGVAMAVLVTGGSMLAAALGWHGAAAAVTTDNALAGILSEALPCLIAYLLLVWIIERRRPSELAWRKLVPHSLVGLALGMALFGLVMGILGSAGAYRIFGTNPSMPWLAAVIVLGVVPAIGEEIITRGVLFRIVEEGLGTWVALLVSALLFGLGHLGNPNATVWSALAIAVEAGLLFGLLYHVTRSLYLCMGLHAAWNIAEGPLYGGPVSGIATPSFIEAKFSGPDWLTGGAFGPEASVVALACCLAIAIPLFVAARRRGSFVAPSWWRREH